MEQVEKRSSERESVEIPGFVKGQDANKIPWQENIRVTSLSKNSAGIEIPRKCRIGNLIFLSAPIPLEMRSNKSEKENYEIWGIIQHCTPFTKEDNTNEYHLGLALIGEKPPNSYVGNPMQHYRLKGISSNGFWNIEETEKEFIIRKYARFWANIEVYLGILDEHSDLSGGEKVFTENISAGGVAALTNLEISKGDCVKFIAADYDFSALAIVRNVQKMANQKMKVHLEFAVAKFPMEKLKV